MCTKNRAKTEQNTICWGSCCIGLQDNAVWAKLQLEEAGGKLCVNCGYFCGQLAPRAAVIDAAQSGVALMFAQTIIFYDASFLCRKKPLLIELLLKGFC